MKYCTNCGNEITDDAEFCGECGVGQSSTPEGSYEERGENEKYCRECGELINKHAEICTECGVRQEPASTESNTGSSGTDQQTAGILAILLGGAGAHKFYQGRTGLGILYLCFSWTFIPIIVGLIEGIMMLTADEDEYEQKYSDGDVFGS